MPFQTFKVLKDEDIENGYENSNQIPDKGTEEGIGDND